MSESPELVRAEAVTYRYPQNNHGLARSVVGYFVFGALGGLLGWLTLVALRRAGSFADMAEKK